ncbi:MAG TPA: methyltransferase domain-containing protein [Candidatus Eremiobacteraceae bacterium]|nr:methyltransferase domain-containing protein [Candidatus Eremiobacteraceae bacterium]
MFEKVTGNSNRTLARSVFKLLGMGVGQHLVTPTSVVAAPQREWEDLARLDPLWGILSEKSKQFGKWDVADFFASGQAEIGALMRSCGLSAGDNGRALDFGCGAGRLSKSLRCYFGQVYGVDISEEMVRLARGYVRDCTFLLNQTDDLKLFQDNFFDFIYSSIVLQHQPTGEVARRYIAEFVRLVRPNGIVVFQMPYKLSLRYAIQPRRRLYSLFRRLGVPPDFIYNKLRLDPMRTISLPSEDIAATVSAAGGRILRSYSDNLHRRSMSYLVTKP